MKTQSDGMERVVKARCGLLMREPFFGTLSLRLWLIESEKCKTMEVNGRDLRFNPTWALELPLAELEAVIAHEVMHCALGHHLRRGGRQVKEWNEATDHAVNHELHRVGFQLPEQALMAPEFKGMASESIYDLIVTRKQDAQAGKQEQSNAQAGGENQKGDGESATGTVEDAVGDAGEAADEADLVSQENDWQQAVAQAAQAARGCGNMPGGIERAIESTLRPKVDWREALQRLVRAKSKDDYNWSRPNRRFLSQRLYLPSLDAPRCGTLAFALDASGSISKALLNQFLAEVEDARRTLRPETTVVMIFDTVVTDGDFYVFDTDEPIGITTRKGGGTRFDGPVLKLAEMTIEPEVLVYLTDLDSRVWPAEPSYPVVWVTTREGQAPFGEVIEMH